MWYTAFLTIQGMSTKPRPAGRGVADSRALTKSAPRTQSALHTAKHPSRCPNCGSTSLSRKGSRTKKFETVQRWQCGFCGRGFTPAPPELRAKTYPLRVILDGVTLYNLGFTLAEASLPATGDRGFESVSLQRGVCLCSGFQGWGQIDGIRLQLKLGRRPQGARLIS